MYSLECLGSWISIISKQWTRSIQPVVSQGRDENWDHAGPPTERRDYKENGPRRRRLSVLKVKLQEKQIRVFICNLSKPPESIQTSFVQKQWRPWSWIKFLCMLTFQWLVLCCHLFRRGQDVSFYFVSCFSAEACLAAERRQVSCARLVHLTT